MRLTMKHWMLGLMALTFSAALSAAPSNFATTAPTGYWLELETVTSHSGGNLDGMTTYRLYLNALNATDYLSSCSGDSENPFIVESTSGSWYNDPASATWNASGVNPAFIAVFPELAFDSFLTLGAEDATAPSAQQPAAVSGAFDFTEEFVGGPGQNFIMNDLIGGAWYAPFPGAGVEHVGFAGEDLRVLVAQFTTEGIMSGQVQVQVFVNSDQGNEFRATLPFCATGECGGCTDESATNYNAEALYDDGSCEFDPNGCTDEAACNFSATATVDDGTCEYPEAFVDCEGNCLNDANGNGICDEAEVDGCTDSLACNYNAEANVDDGTCEFESCQWCDDPEACNYDGEGLPWTANTALCEFILEGECDCEGNVLDAAGVCGGTCETDEDGDGICDDEDECIGVIDACGICNGPGAIYECGCADIPEGQCDCEGTLIDAVGVCGGNCAVDADQDGWCDECINTPVEGYALETEVVQVHTEGSLQGLTTYRVYMNCANATDYVNACSGDNTNPMVFASASGSWFNHAVNTSFTASGVNPEVFDMFPALEFDSYLTIGAEFTNDEHPQAIWGDIDASAEFDGDASGFNVTVDDETGGAWYLPFPGLTEADSHPGFAGEEGRVLLMQMTTAGPISGQIQVQIFQNGDQGDEIRQVFLYNSEFDVTDCDNLDPCDGVIDECGVCNGPGAIFDCGCTVLPQGDCDCDGNQLDALGVCGGDCVEDNDGDGVCDLLAEGCTDLEACNYIAAVVDNGQCEYPEEYYDCFGECLLDSDADGVCDELEVFGCTDEAACNYDSTATEEDGSCAELDECGECGGTGYLACIDEAACNYDAGGSCDDGSCTYPDPYLECDGSCTNDADGDGVCDELEIVGCQDEAGCNYSAEATDDGACEYAELYYDCDGNCQTDTDGDGVCDELEILGCTDDTACNYDASATEADDSCEYAVDFYDCAGNCLMDTDEDGVCDELEVEGCTDDTACNFDPAATETDDSCEYPEAYYDCAGNCLNDEDEDGVCDELEIPGCTDETACNFSAEATEEDGTCTYPAEFFDCEGNCLVDTDEDGVCDELEVLGCTDGTACNFSEEATEEDGSCEYPQEFYDCEGNCLNDEDEDGVCDELEVPGCTDPDACNYDAEATDENGSCDYPGDTCDDGDDTTINDVYTADCDCAGEVDGLDEAAALSWTLYPSPVRDVLNLRVDGGAWSSAFDGDVEVLVLGATGQVLRSERLAGRTQLDVSDLASGIYFLTLRSPAMATTTRRFVVAGGE